MLYDERQPIDFNQLRKIPDVCSYCQREFQPWRTRTLDHIIPTSVVGKHKNIRSDDIVLNNLLICCYECNQAKANRSLIEWLSVLDDYMIGNKSKSRAVLRNNIRNTINILLTKT